MHTSELVRHESRSTTVLSAEASNRRSHNGTMRRLDQPTPRSDTGVGSANKRVEAEHMAKDESVNNGPVTVDTTHAKPNSRVDRVQPKSAQEAGQDSSSGTTNIADAVVAKVAGIAARQVKGVYALGGTGARALGALRDAVNVTDLTQGVSVEVGETQAAADLTIVVDYPEPVHEVAEAVRSAVADAITRLVGLEVVEINIDVTDVHLPDDSDEDDEGRVQ